MSEPSIPDLSACAREPIHVPGAIQPHGVLFALGDDGRVRMVSENVADRLGGAGPADLLDRPLAEALGAGPAAEVVAALEDLDPAANGPLRLELGPSGAWDAILHVVPEGPILELEPAKAEDPRSVVSLYRRVRAALARLQSARSMDALHRAMADVVADLTGMDKVMVYRFDPEWNGEVVAERSTGALDDYLGLRFPSTDIPSQARELYRRNWLRLIADSAYRPARLVPSTHPDTGEPLDLSGATLRSVSPVHLEYLRNMDVGASMSVSLLHADRLWGLVACHHATPYHVPYTVRTACEFLGQTFSVQLAALADERETEYALALERTQARILERLAGRTDWAVGLEEGEPALHDVAGAESAALRFRGSWISTGTVPRAAELEALTARLERDGDSVFRTDRLPEVHPPAAAYADRASGLLAVRLGREEGEWILWFRPEQVETVAWAGDPRKPVAPEDDAPPSSAAHAGPVPRLHPRRSFASWVETVRGRARPWTPTEVGAASAFRVRIVELILRQAEELGRLNRELRRSNEELDAFSYMAGHDLKEPLRGVRTWAGILAERAPELTAEGEPLAEIVALSERMEGMLDSLLRYARAEHLELERRPVDLQALVDEVVRVLGHRLDQAGAEVSIPRRLPVVSCDPVRVASIFQNLLSNAIKFNESGRPRIDITWRGGDGEPVALRVADNGIGIAEKDRERVFQLFRRLHPKARYGGGTGAGLTIARRLVERHGGRIAVTSPEEGGTAFEFTLEANSG